MIDFTTQQTLDRLRAENERLSAALRQERVAREKAERQRSEDAQQGGVRYARKKTD